MEYDRALYRVYDRCLEGLRDNNTEAADIGRKSCQVLEHISLLSACFFLFCLIFLHTSFVGKAGCLPTVLHNRRNLLNQTNTLIAKDQIMQIDVSDLVSFGADDTGSNPLNEDDLEERLSKIMLNRKSESKNQTKINNGEKIKPKNVSNHDYEFALSYSILSLSDEIRVDHKFEMFNVTLSGHHCFGSSITQSLLPLGGIDTVVLNFVMYTIRKPGFLKTMDGDVYSWDEHDLKPYSNFMEWFGYKLGILFTSLIAFFFLSTTTALLVRVLISSGVVLMFPLFWALQV